MVVVPMLPEPILENEIWYWQIHGDGGVCWSRNEFSSVLDSIAQQSDYSPEDRLFLQSPDSFSTHWFVITNVEIAQMKDLTPYTLSASGLYPSSTPPRNKLTQVIAHHLARFRWNKTHPDYRWDNKRWVLLISLMAMSGG